MKSRKTGNNQATLPHTPMEQPKTCLCSKLKHVLINQLFKKGKTFGVGIELPRGRLSDTRFVTPLCHQLKW